VVAFGASDPHSGTERLIVVAETRERPRDAQASAAIAAQVTARVADTLGLPPDAVELLPPQSIPKTSSGKLRRNETRRLYLAGKLGRANLPAWFQVARLGAASGVRVTGGGLRRAFELLYGMWGAVAFTIFILPTWTLTYLAPTKRLACRITQIGTRIFFALIGCRIRIHGREHLSNGGPFVFVSNHASYFDVVLILATFKLPYRFVSKMEVASWPFIGTFIRRREDFTFVREDHNERLRQAEAQEQVLRQGESLFIFPEGTFTAYEGIRPFQLGAFKAAVATGTPVCPIALSGVRQLYRDDTRLPRPSRITMTICPPLAPDPNASPWHEMLRLRDAARAAIAAHSGEPLL
jgi:1-acyl-sn-glycerol-3-phosphate acyltransferase